MFEFIPGVTPCYAPTPTEKFLQCQLRWALDRKWRPRALLTRADVARSVGIAFHKGIELYFNDRKCEGKTVIPGLYVDAAVDNFKNWLNTEAHRGCDQEARTEIEVVPKTLEGMLRQFVAQEHLTKLYNVVSVELTLKPWGNCRLDLVLSDDLGLIVPDIKTRVYSSRYYRDQEFLQFPYTRQAYHYTWAAEQHFKEEVNRVILLVVPRNTRPTLLSETYYVNREYRETVWRLGSIEVWRNMYAVASGQRFPIPSDTHRFHNKTCEYFRACTHHMLRHSSMLEDYTERVKNDKTLR